MNDQASHIEGVSRRVSLAPRRLGALEALRLLHYGGQLVNTNSHPGISFWRKHDGGFENLGGILAHELGAHWHRLAPHIQRDAYFTINSVSPAWKAARSKITRFPLWKRSREKLLWLNALWVDLDQHCDAHLAFPDLLHVFELTREQAGLPPPSLLVSSGRGLWALWRLHNHKNLSEPVPAMSDQLAIWQRVEGALVEVFNGDLNCKDPARLMRIPCSWNTNASLDRREVLFWLYSDITYSIPELANVLGVRAEETPITTSVARDTSVKNPRRQAAGRMRWERTWAGFMRLVELRGHMPEGCRRNSIYVAAFLLARQRRSPAMINSVCHEFATSWGVAAREVRKRVEYGMQLARNFAQISNRTLRKLVKVTDKELESIPEWKSRPQRKPRLSRKEITQQVQERRARLQAQSAMAPNLSSRKLAASLKVHHATVLRDLRATAVTVSPTGADVSGTYGVNLLLPATPAPGPQTVTASRTRSFERERRRRILAQWISSPASVRDMTERLRNEHGINVSHMTIARDLAVIRAAGMAMDRDFTLCMEGDPMEHALESSVKEAKRNGESERKRAAAGVVA